VPEEKCAIHFNFTLFSPGESVDQNEKKDYKNLMDDMGWFMFNLLALGYVSDAQTGKSFRIPRNCSLRLYIEVPSSFDEQESVTEFFNFIPICEFAGSLKFIDETYEYVIDDDVQLVCKYLQAYETKAIDCLYDSILH
jgi:hypothetical protein